MFVGFGELRWEQYTVQSGDTLGKIAAKYGVDVDTIAGQNDIQDVNLIQVGQVLDIPIEDTQFAQDMEKLAAEPKLPVYVIPKQSTTPISVTTSGSIAIKPTTPGTIFGIKSTYVYIGIGLLLVAGVAVLARPSRRTQPAMA